MKALYIAVFVSIFMPTGAHAEDPQPLDRRIARAVLDMRTHLGQRLYSTPRCPEAAASLTVQGEASLRCEEAKKAVDAEEKRWRIARGDLAMVTRLLEGASTTAARDVVAQAQSQLDAASLRRAEAQDRALLYETILRRFGAAEGGPPVKVGTDIACVPTARPRQ